MPAAEPGRFPMHGGDAPVPVFYDLPAQRDWVDFSTYWNELTADRIIEWARLIKEETGGRKLSCSSTATPWSCPAASAATTPLHRVLDCPEVDILAGPWSYHDRRGPSPTSFMSLVDTITAHGKLWFSEDDSRTSVMDPAVPGPNWATSFNGPITTADLDETLTVIGRNWTAIQTHRAGTWWMDLHRRRAVQPLGAGRAAQATGG